MAWRKRERKKARATKFFSMHEYSNSFPITAGQWWNTGLVTTRSSVQVQLGHSHRVRENGKTKFYKGIQIVDRQIKHHEHWH